MNSNGKVKQLRTYMEGYIAVDPNCDKLKPGDVTEIISEYLQRKGVKHEVKFRLHRQVVAGDSAHKLVRINWDYRDNMY